MEGKVIYQSVHDKGCIGCKRFKSDVMITFTVKDKGEFHDFFLSTQQAEILVKEINKALESNKMRAQKIPWYKALVHAIKKKRK